jgi:hypothetical protein
VPDPSSDRLPPPPQTPPWPQEATTPSGPWTMTPDAVQGLAVEGTGHHRPVDDRPAARCPPGACLALLGDGADGCPARRRTPQHAPTERRRRPPSHGAGQAPPRPCRDLAPGSGDANQPPAYALAPARAYPPPATLLLEPGATTTAPPTCECPSRPHQHAWGQRSAPGPPDHRRGLHLTPGLGQADMACLCPGPHQAIQLRPASATLRLSRARKPQRSGGWRQSAPGPAFGVGWGTDLRTASSCRPGAAQTTDSTPRWRPGCPHVLHERSGQIQP